jgi:transposase-like protein
MKCPECGSAKLNKYGLRFVAGGKKGGKRQKVQQYQCQSCGRVTIKPK